jgi:hypothetical protein
LNSASTEPKGCILPSSTTGSVCTRTSHLGWQQLKVLRAIQHCRTAALGGHLDQCSRCGHRAISFFSCRNRHCPKCQTNARNKWLAARSEELLGVSYFHVVFTLPHELSVLTLQNRKALYDLLFQTGAATLEEVAADPKHLGADIGFLSVLHTWGRICKPIRTYTASSPPVDCRQTTRAGFNPGTTSFCR